MKTSVKILLVICIFLGIGTWIFISMENSQGSSGPDASTGASTTAQQSFDQAGDTTGSTTLELALLDYRDVGQESDGVERGCDRVVFVQRYVPNTPAPLTAALNELFSLETEAVDGWNNFIAKTNNTLEFDRAAVANGTARIYLEGELSGLAGVCDNPRAAIQITETAKQFETVNVVELFLNGEPTDLAPSERGS